LLFAHLALAVAAAGPATSWDVGAFRRYFVEDEVWSDRGIRVESARATATAREWRSRLVLGCHGDRDDAGRTEVRCHVEDAAVDTPVAGGAAVAAELRDAVLVLTLGDDGHVATARATRRRRAVSKAATTVLLEAAVGLDLASPPEEPAASWRQRESCLLARPGERQFVAAGEVTHRVLPCADSPRPESVVSDSCQRTPSARAGRDLLMCSLRAWIDGEALVERRWATVTLDVEDPNLVTTARFGRLELLSETVAVGVGDSGVLAPPTRTFDAALPRLDAAALTRDARCP
jgi:hypothetical protein